MQKIEIVNFTQNYLTEIEIIFSLNVPKYFAPKEWNELLNYLEKHRKTYFVAKKNGAILGCGGYFKSSTNIARLSWDFIHPGYHGQGIGRKIIEHCLLEIKKDASIINSIEVWTSQHAYKIYEKFGLNVIETKEHHWAENLHLYRMSS